MRIVYMGTPEFAVPGLELLHQNGYEIVGVITAPDKPAGRGQTIQQSAVKKKALELGLHLLQPSNLKDPEFIEELKALKADLQIVVAFRMLPELVWNMPPLGTFNLHASLLPLYRGAAPINWAIINGEIETGITTFFLKHEIDTGNIILQEKEPILESDNLGSLYERLMHKGSLLILKTVQQISTNSVIATPQLLNKVEKHAPKITKETGRINTNLSATEMHNLVRGLNPVPGAFIVVNGKSYKLFHTKVVESFSTSIGEIKSDKKTYLYIQTKDNALSILEIQPEGKKRMSIVEYLRGNSIEGKIDAFV